MAKKREKILTSKPEAFIRLAQRAKTAKERVKTHEIIAEASVK